MPLDDLQRALAASLAASGAEAPAGLDPQAVERARRSLVAKRRRAAAHLLPRLRTALGEAWAERFGAHARDYTPEGLLHHVDDAWALAETLVRDPALRPAALDDLLTLRLRYARDRRASAGRIRERRAPLLARMRTRPLLVLRLPGVAGRVWFLRIPMQLSLPGSVQSGKAL